MNPRRQDRLSHALRTAVQEVLGRGLADPRARGLITVTEVEVSPDARNATVYVSVFPEDRVTLTMHALRDAEGFVRREAADLVRTRTMPVLTFKFDDRIKKEAAVLRAINQACGERPADEQATDARAAGDAGDDSGQPKEPAP
ncbi:MAG: 30S ribosome-binding factor RbfA [Phycisphaerales bacterium]